MSSVRDLHAVQQAVVKATGHTAVIAKLANGRFLGVSMTNSPFASLPDDARRAKAQAIAQVAFDAYPPRASLASVSVVFVKSQGELLHLHLYRRDRCLLVHAG